MTEQLPDYIVKCDVPGPGKHYGDNCTDGCLALVEHATRGKKDYWKETPKPKPKARRLRYEDQIIHGIYTLYSYLVLCQSQTLFVD